MNIRIKSEEELLEVCRNALHILKNLRHNSQIWDREYGAKNKDAKKYWENKADVFLNDLNVQRSGTVHDIHITVNKEDDDQLGINGKRS